LKVSQFALSPGFDEDEDDEDDGFEHFVPVESEHDEEEDFGQEEGEATVDAWADRLADEFIVTDVGAEIKRDWRGWSWPRRYTKNAERVESVFSQFELPRPRGLFVRLARRCDVPKATVWFRFGELVCDEKWRPFGHRAGRSSRRLFSDEVEERIVKEIEEKFQAEERKLLRRTFTDFVKRFWLTHRAGFGSQFSTNCRARLSMRRRCWGRRRLGSPQPGWGEFEDKELAEEARPEQGGERRRGVG
jgi:hypothetical protein